MKQDVYNKQLIEQLIDSAFSAAANYRASQRGKSKRDALNKIKISLEEIDESNLVK
ncbi:MAG: four helix bundle protein [Bacteroidetes bacterium]|nr:four helix bundle protein [Bacteroidota bacterium]